MVLPVQGGASSASCGMGAPEFRARQHTPGPKFRPIQCSSHGNPVARTCDGRAAMNGKNHSPSPPRTSRWEASPLRAALGVEQRGCAKDDDTARGGPPWAKTAEPCIASIATTPPGARPHRGQVERSQIQGGADVAGSGHGFIVARTVDGSVFGACRVLTGPENRGTHPARVRACAALNLRAFDLPSMPVSRTTPSRKRCTDSPMGESA